MKAYFVDPNMILPLPFSSYAQVTESKPTHRVLDAVSRVDGFEAFERTETVVNAALDYNLDKPDQFDVIINLYTHRKEIFLEFEGKLYEGLDYAIISHKIRELSPTFSDGVFICLGGDPSEENVKKVVARVKPFLMKFNIEARFHAFTDFSLIFQSDSNLQFYQNKRMKESMEKSKMFITNCGGACLEALSLGVKPLCFPQSEVERSFFSYLKNENFVLDFFETNFEEIYSYMPWFEEAQIIGGGAEKVIETLIHFRKES